MCKDKIILSLMNLCSENEDMDISEDYEGWGNWESDEFVSEDDYIPWYTDETETENKLHQIDEKRPFYHLMTKEYEQQLTKRKLKNRQEREQEQGRIFDFHRVLYEGWGRLDLENEENSLYLTMMKECEKQMIEEYKIKKEQKILFDIHFFKLKNIIVNISENCERKKCSIDNINDLSKACRICKAKYNDFKKIISNSSFEDNKLVNTPIECSSQYSIFHFACVYANFILIDYLCKKFGSNINSANSDNMTPLMLMIANYKNYKGEDYIGDIKRCFDLNNVYQYTTISIRGLYENKTAINMCNCILKKLKGDIFQYKLYKNIKEIKILMTSHLDKVINKLVLQNIGDNLLVNIFSNIVRDFIYDTKN